MKTKEKKRRQQKVHPFYGAWRRSVNSQRPDWVSTSISWQQPCLLNIINIGHRRVETLDSGSGDSVSAILWLRLLATPTQRSHHCQSNLRRAEMYGLRLCIRGSKILLYEKQETSVSIRWRSLISDSIISYLYCRPIDIRWWFWSTPQSPRTARKQLTDVGLLRGRLWLGSEGHAYRLDQSVKWSTLVYFNSLPLKMLIGDAETVSLSKNRSKCWWLLIFV